LVGTKRGSVVSLREGLREGRRRQKVTRLVGTKRGSVVGRRWVPREGLRVQGKKRRVESSRQGTVVWETIQDKLKTQDNSRNNF
jgi:hypothetical protein